jgi:putative DNA primase/helicase
MAPCPAHADRTPSLSIQTGYDGKILVCCHAGCEQGRVVAVLKARGLWSESGRRKAEGVGGPFMGANRTGFNDTTMQESVPHIIAGSVQAGGTIVETYLASRQIIISPPRALRFHNALKHTGGERWPAMVALVTRGVDALPLGIHRTFLARDGLGKAPVEPAKMMLGPCRGGAVRLAPIDSVLLIGEGIETCLTAMQATGFPSWAALSTSGLRALELPVEARDLIVLADGDDAGEAAAIAAARRWRDEGRRVRIARPPRGLDFNDLLCVRHSPNREDGHDTK